MTVKGSRTLAVPCLARGNCFRFICFHYCNTDRWTFSSFYIVFISVKASLFSVLLLLYIYPFFRFFCFCTYYAVVQCLCLCFVGGAMRVIFQLIDLSVDISKLSTIIISNYLYAHPDCIECDLQTDFRMCV